MWFFDPVDSRIAVPDGVPPGLSAGLRRTLEAKRPLHRLQISGHHTASIPASIIGSAYLLDRWDVSLALTGDPELLGSVGGDVRYYAYVLDGLREFVRAGRIVPTVDVTEDNEWIAQWIVVRDAEFTSWMRLVLDAMPPVLFHNGGHSALDDFVYEMTDYLVREHLAAQSPPSSSFGLALFDDPEVTASRAVVQHWRSLAESLVADDEVMTITFRLDEPQDIDPVGVIPDDVNEDDSTAAEDGYKWVLTICVDDDGVLTALRELSPDERQFAEVLGHLRRAVAAFPELAGCGLDTKQWGYLLTPDTVVSLVDSGAAALRENGFAVLLPKPWTIITPSLALKGKPTDHVVAAAHAQVGLDALTEFDWRLSVGDDELTERDITSLVRQQGSLVKLRGEWVFADGSALTRAARWIREQEREQSSTTMRQLLTLLASDEPPLEVTEIDGLGWLDALTSGTTGTSSLITATPAGVRAELRPYQLRGLSWLAYMAEQGLGAILADDMGLGKTLQLLSLEAHEADRRSGPTLLICPMSVVGNWEREAARFVPDLGVHTHHGADRELGDEFIRRARSSNLVLTTYQTAVRDRDLLSRMHWDRIVLDEAQHIKNSASSQAKAIRTLPSVHRIALTGTPLENRLDELRSLMDFVNPGILGDRKTFRAKYAVPIERERDPKAIKRLSTLTTPFILRRLKSDAAVIDDLPEKNEITVRANLTAEQAALYEAVTRDALARIYDADGIGRKGQVLVLLSHLKQVCDHPALYHSDGSPLLRGNNHRSGKLALIEDIVDTILADNEKVLLFTQYASFGELLVPWLRTRFGCEVPFLHGGTARSRRERMVADFECPDGPPILVLSLKAGGTGLNLTAANHVVHMDRWWNPAVEDQATDRAFRIGQRKDVQVHKLVCVGTLEERIDSMIRSKRELANLTVGVGEKWLTEINAEELADLVRLSTCAVGE